MNALTLFKETSVAGNELWRIALLFTCVLGSLLIGQGLKYGLGKGGKRFDALGNATRAAALRALALSVTLIAFTVGLKQGLLFVHMPPTLADWAASAMGVLFSLSIGWMLYCLVDAVAVWLDKVADRTQSKMDDMLVPLVRKSLRVTLVVMVLVQVATVLSDKPITSVLAGLGVGGLAVALAAQETIKNFFGSIVILADKPFELGDRIQVDGHDGPVEEVGFRSTKIRTLEGHLVTVPNGEMANKTIQNIGRRPFIRRVADITVTYDTPPDRVDRAVEILKELLDNHEGMHPDFPPRVYFSGFNDASLNIQVIYWYHPPDYWAYMAFSEKFNRDVLARFNEEDIEFAFPTQTLYLAGDPKRPLGWDGPGASV